MAWDVNCGCGLLGCASQNSVLAENAVRSAAKIYSNSANRSSPSIVKGIVVETPAAAILLHEGYDADFLMARTQKVSSKWRT